MPPWSATATQNDVDTHDDEPNPPYSSPSATATAALGALHAEPFQVRACPEASPARHQEVPTQESVCGEPTKGATRTGAPHVSGVVVGDAITGHETLGNESCAHSE